MAPTFYPNKPTVGYFTNLQQGSEEWLEFRKDKITATGAYKILQGESIQDILTEKENEKDFTGNYYTERGHILEDEARLLYEELNSTQVTEVGAVINTKYPQYACSPDGLVRDENGGIEIKAFKEDRQEDVFQNLDPHIIAQIQFNLFVTECDWWDWILYNPEVKDISKAYHCKRFYPDEEIFKKFRDALSKEEDPLIQEKALEIYNLQNELERVHEQIKNQLEDFQIKQQELENLKEQLRKETSGKIKKIIKLGDNTLDISVYDTNRITVKDASLVPDEYTTTVQVDNTFQAENGKYYQKVPNPKLAGNMFKAGKKLPPGFEVKTSRNVSIKYNGKSI